MKRMAATFLLVVAFLTAVAVKEGKAEMEWEVKETLKVDAKVLDLAVSSDGKYFYVLTADGKVSVYNSGGQVEDTLNVGKSINRLDVSPDGSFLYLADDVANTVKIAEVSYMADINITGSPFKGPADAPVAVVVYSDYQ